MIKGDAWHSAGFRQSLPLNRDGIVHTVGLVDANAGKVKLGFEDLNGGGDRDFDDAVFSVDIGNANVNVLSAHGITGAAAAGSMASLSRKRPKPYIEAPMTM